MVINLDISGIIGKIFSWIKSLIWIKDEEPMLVNTKFIAQYVIPEIKINSKNPDNLKFVWCPEEALEAKKKQGFSLYYYLKNRERHLLMNRENQIFVFKEENNN